jgi:hypothetical protein
MYFSAFLPMLIVMWVKEVIILVIQSVEKLQCSEHLVWRMFINVYLLIELGIICFVAFSLCFLLCGNTKASTKMIKVIKVVNQVTNYYLGYYSLFVLALIGFSLVSVADIVSLCLLMIILGIVYIKNGMYYMNPTVNLMRSFIYEIEYTEGNKTISKIIIAKEKIYTDDIIIVYNSEFEFTLMKEKKAE